MKVESLGREAWTEAIEVLAAAFEDYPVMRYVLRDSGESYAEHLRGLVGLFCEKRLSRDWPVLGVRAAGRLCGIALISEPEGTPEPDGLARARDALEAAIGQGAVGRLARYESESGADFPKEPHHFLGMIGILPEHQGKGYARPLIREVHRIVDAHPKSAGVCLNTEVRENVALYRHLGYEILAERDVDELHTWCMFRRRGDV